MEDWLHQELEYIRNGAEVYRGRFNFAFLGEMAEKEFKREFDRSFLRRFALRHGYYHALPEEKEKGYLLGYYNDCREHQETEGFHRGGGRRRLEREKAN